jgi:hypothetical protein
MICQNISSTFSSLYYYVQFYKVSFNICNLKNKKMIVVSLNDKSNCLKTNYKKLLET